MAFLGPYNAALVNPSLILLSKAFDVDSKTAAYSSTTGIILGGVSPFIFTPLTNYYGRRPITLIAILITILGSIASGLSPNFTALLLRRAFSGFGFGGMMSVGTSCVNDMFFLHERGEMTGVYTIFVTNGAHVAALSKSSSTLAHRPPPLLAREQPPTPLQHHLRSKLIPPPSRRFPRPSCWLAMGLLPRRDICGPLFRDRHLPLPRNALLARPQFPRNPHPRTDIHADALGHPW